ncbi:pilus motility taxis protein HmpF [Kovacikia minuta CCNUW1]|uniref:pilus motility taxis protein HmpF n=1 Tax=Kovacikia minuta TaxID=2931930 RepID=UPI001CCF3503|nr:pilus motility taxis protein HmpF [Kovacikia minuta]UBF26945.1 pilus motility taxis protein HmpF [Kovacikia minuta CCNUW1]
MLYLAEVQKKTGGLLGGGRAELKLLACQRSEQSWSAVPGEELVVCEEANNYNGGALLLVDLTANKQVQRVQEAGRQLVSILQNFSRLQEKFKTQEEEIEQWKQSLTYQSQELNRREMEMEARREQLQQMEEDFEQLEQQRQEIETQREEVTRQRDEFDRNRQELEGAWDHLRGEMRRFEEKQAEFQQSAFLDDEQANAIQELLNRLSGAIPATESVREDLNQSLEILTQQQNSLTQHWQTLEQQRSTTQQMQAEVDQQAQDIHQRWQEWHQAQESLEQARAELKVQQSSLNQKQESAQMLGVQLQNQEDLHQQVYRLADSSEKVAIGQHVDLESLEKIPLDELQKVVQDLERDLQKLSQFVESQEEELQLKQQEIDQIKAKIEAANGLDLNLENELADEQDGYQMLNETLVGQRRNLRERKNLLNRHQAVLRRRQGHSDGNGQEDEIDLGPILSQIEALRHQQADELHKLESQIEQMRTAIGQAQGLVTSQTAEQENKRNDLKQQEQKLLDRRREVAELWGRVNLYQEMLQPIQDNVDGLRHKLESLAGSMSQVQEAGGEQERAIAEMRQILVNLTNTPELAAS